MEFEWIIENIIESWEVEERVTFLEARVKIEVKMDTWKSDRRSLTVDWDILWWIGSKFYENSIEYTENFVPLWREKISSFM